MSTFPISFRIAQAVGLTGAAWLSGNIAALSLITIPALTQSQDSVPPGILAKQWKYLYDLGKAQNPPIAAVTAASFSYLAWSVRSGKPLNLLVPRNAVQLYAAAAVFTLGIVPYTLLTMSSTNNRLISKAGAGAKGKGVEVTGEDKEVGELLRKWQVLNGIRGVIPLLGVVAGFVAVLG